ncbi:MULTISPECIES: IclR family transcriptional regulator [unclassified Mycolicibacterium]|uniref:IclR family transcriptional regulator n=1 Tax=unclassified Mycolicibacterium TaxID=2636767 RepID=UPI0012DC830A|nr:MULTISPECIES: IclR family transcriptional regulator [unclassified Mycolicibacterium]MUL83007.1 IclR family transcriptional regulator [Mycolicibacterium sp. CBMA 329]MUL89342.1 IclR family transcriptional regulator [Mycolicibacterium sp. CBMA 331]MUL99031.1 IclR family transcriptional regulator [Mycolicibacterium sp. CBMA 334]MUM25671.1 IclR family transcriptional regulator [Mycolicibacterium sp. CBMA 295]MUM38858.1 IclR family transcriptional regulator [Mycolicibacterium sp. CBMA 247]
MAGNTSTPGASVAARTLSVLGAYDATHRALTLTELAQRTSLPTATTYRLVAQLQDWGALVRRPDGTYVIGRRIWDLGLLAPIQTGIRQAAEPFLHDLYAATKATVHLAQRDELTVLYLDRLAGHESVPVVSRVGSRLPMHATGVGKALLAHAPSDVRDQVLASLTRVTPHTVISPRLLADQLRRVHSQGYATTVEEMSLGACSVAVPIRGPQGVVAALGIVVPSLRNNRPRLVAALRVAAQGISRTMGAPPPPDFEPG